MNKIVSLTLLIAASSIVMGCDQKADSAKEPKADRPPMTEQVISAPDKSNITIEHPNGETTVAINPKRIITMDFATMDTLHKLGLDQRIVAFPKGNLPHYLEPFDRDSYANAGSMKEPDLEAIRSLKPDLIIITGRQGKSYLQLSEIAPTVNLGIDSKHYWASFTHNAERLGSLFDKRDAVNEEIARLDKKITALKVKTQKLNLKGLVILHNDGKLASANAGSYATLIHDIMGLERADVNIEPKRQAADQAYLSAINPDVIFIIDRSAAIGQRPFEDSLPAAEAMRVTDAYKNSRIIYLTPDLWYLSGGGLESLSLQLDEVSDALS